jgi:biotin carboxylase
VPAGGDGEIVGQQILAAGRAARRLRSRAIAGADFVVRNRPRLLIAGGGHADIPLILAGQRLGYHVISSGNRADGLGHRLSDEYAPCDFSDRHAMLELARRLRIDAICSCCNDFSAITAAFVAERMGLPGHDSYETTLQLHHKDSFRAFAAANGIAAPVAVGASDVDSVLRAADRLALPLLVKPVDLSGGKGISRVEEPSQLVAAVEAARAASRSGRVVIEEFLEGTRHGFSALLRDGKVVFCFADNEHYFCNPYLVSAASTPSCLPASAISSLIEQAETIARLMQLGTGVFHVQLILHRGEPVIVEICRRAPGDLYLTLVELATGLDYALQIVRAAIGDDLSDLASHPASGCFTRHCVMGDRNGILKEVAVDDSLAEKIVDQMMWWKAGAPVADYLTDKHGIVFLEFASAEEMLVTTERLPELIRPVVV